MDSPTIIKDWFPHISEQTYTTLCALGPLYADWNEKINVISRKDIDHLYLHHIAHALCITKFITFKPGSKILDLGTGGGLPGIPLAVCYPDVQFMLVDSINKKLKVVLDICESLGIDNVSVAHNRVENIQGQYDFIVTRAVAKMDLIIGWSKHLLAKRHMHGYPNGWIALKGDIKEEKKILKKLTYSESVPLTKYINDPYYEGKYVLYAQGL